MKLGTFLMLAAGVPIAVGPASYLLTPMADDVAVAKSVASAGVSPLRPLPPPSPPEAGLLDVDVRVGHASLSADGDRETFVLVRAHATPQPVSGTRPPSNTALVIDQSGSMQGQRLRHAVVAAKAWIDRANDGDVISLSTFANGGNVDWPASSLSPAIRSELTSTLDALVAGGGTCLSCGVERALTQVARSEHRVRQLLVLSDGVANAGIVDEAGFEPIADDFRERGISITTIGLGSTYDARLLSALSLSTNGNHYFVGSPSELPAVFEQEARGMQETLVADAKATIDLGPGVEVVKVFDRSFHREGSRVTVPFGVLAPEATKTVLVKVRLPKGGATAPVADVRVSHRQTLDDTLASVQRALSVELTDGPDAAIDPGVATRLARAETVAAMRVATERFEAGDKSAAIQTLDERLAHVRQESWRLLARATTSRDGRAELLKKDFDEQAAMIEGVRARYAKTQANTRSGRLAARRAFRPMHIGME